MKPTKGIAVDGACEGNPGIAEYKGVVLGVNKIIFQKKIGLATNNIAEFLAIVHALALFKDKEIDIYSDSQTAIIWVQKKYCGTSLDICEKTKFSLELIDRALNFVRNNEYKCHIKKWNTKQWGEIPADFNRKSYVR